MVVVRVNEAYYLGGLEDFKTHLHGWIILSKGDKPLTHLDLTKKVAAGVEGSWTVEGHSFWEGFL